MREACTQFRSLQRTSTTRLCLDVTHPLPPALRPSGHFLNSRTVRAQEGNAGGGSGPAGRCPCECVSQDHVSTRASTLRTCLPCMLQVSIASVQPVGSSAMCAERAPASNSPVWCGNFELLLRWPLPGHEASTAGMSMIQGLVLQNSTHAGRSMWCLCRSRALIASLTEPVELLLHSHTAATSLYRERSIDLSLYLRSKVTHAAASARVTVPPSLDAQVSRSAEHAGVLAVCEKFVMRCALRLLRQ